MRPCAQSAARLTPWPNPFDPAAKWRYTDPDFAVAAAAERHDRRKSGDGVAKVIARIRPMIDAIAPAAGDPTLQAAELIHGPPVIEQTQPFRVD